MFKLTSILIASSIKLYKSIYILATLKKAIYKRLLISYIITNYLNPLVILRKSLIKLILL